MIVHVEYYREVPCVCLAVAVLDEVQGVPVERVQVMAFWPGLGIIKTDVPGVRCMVEGLNA